MVIVRFLETLMTYVSHRLDWQLEIQALRILESPRIDTAIKRFTRNLSFRSGVAAESIFSIPKRRVNIPHDAPVSKVTEKASVSYQLKGTNYITEISRYDEYRRVGSAKGQIGSFTISGQPHTVSWRVCVFDPNWDHIFGENEHLRAGQRASWPASLGTFFRPGNWGSADDAQAGFEWFAGLCKQVADLLSSAEQKT